MGFVKVWSPWKVTDAPRMWTPWKPSATINILMLNTSKSKTSGIIKFGILKVLLLWGDKNVIEVHFYTVTPTYLVSTVAKEHISYSLYKMPFM